MANDMKMADVEVAKEFLHDGIRFFRLPNNLRRCEVSGDQHEVNALQVGGGEGYLRTTYIADHTTVRVFD